MDPLHVIAYAALPLSLGVVALAILLPLALRSAGHSTVAAAHWKQQHDACKEFVEAATYAQRAFDSVALSARVRAAERDVNLARLALALHFPVRSTVIAYSTKVTVRLEDLREQHAKDPASSATVSARGRAQEAVHDFVNAARRALGNH
jgi:hypothetical protein